ncbi:MAG: DUF2585 family protein [Kiritimatiellae bacterium]|nr:DUF2585 family protein [Kiritimatiellia bacterium]
MVKRKLPGYGIAACFIVLITLLVLRLEGRVVWCACRSPSLWAGDIWSAHNSQHLFDPYSFTHILHGMLFCGLLALLTPRLSLKAKLILTLALEATWEVMENSPFIIQRYREATIGLGYEGDSMANSLGDLLCCVVGFLLAKKLGFRWSLVVFIVTELILLFAHPGPCI